DGKYVLTGDVGGTVRQWDVQTGAEVRHFDEPDAQIPPAGLAISPDGHYFLATSFTSPLAVRLWDMRSGQQVRQFADGSRGVAFSPDGKYALAGGNDLLARLWEVQTGQLVRTFAGHTDLVVAVAFAADGRTVLT